MQTLNLNGQDNKRVEPHSSLKWGLILTVISTPLLLLFLGHASDGINRFLLGHATDGANREADLGEADLNEAYLLRGSAQSAATPEFTEFVNCVDHMIATRRVFILDYDASRNADVLNIGDSLEVVSQLCQSPRWIVLWQCAANHPQHGQMDICQSQTRELIAARLRRAWNKR